MGLGWANAVTLVRAAEELALLPAGSMIADMLSDYAVMALNRRALTARLISIL